jgi:integrase
MNSVQNRQKGSSTHMLWKVELNKLLAEHKAKHAIKDKTVSTRTKDNRDEVLFRCFKELRELGYKLDNPRNLREKHFEALLKHWIEKGLSASTMQGNASVLRVFCTWINRPNMIKSLETYVDDKTLVRRTQVAQVDKSWTGNGIDFEEVLKRIDAYDERAGVQLRVIKAFGLRREEAICFQPIRAMKLGEDQNSIYVEKGTKNGLKRHVPIDNDYQREVLAIASRLARTTDAHIGWEELSLKQAVKRIANIMQKFGITKKDMGVTLHGLRHEKMHSIYEEVTGQPCPVKGGKKEYVDPELDILARNKMTQAAGHARLGITNAYAGSHHAQSNKTSASGNASV